MTSSTNSSLVAPLKNEVLQVGLDTSDPHLPLLESNPTKEHSAVHSGTIVQVTRLVNNIFHCNSSDHLFDPLAPQNCLYLTFAPVLPPPPLFLSLLSIIAFISFYFLFPFPYLPFYFSTSARNAVT